MNKHIADEILIYRGSDDAVAFVVRADTPETRFFVLPPDRPCTDVHGTTKPLGEWIFGPGWRSKRYYSPSDVFLSSDGKHVSVIRSHLSETAA